MWWNYEFCFVVRSMKDLNNGAFLNACTTVEICTKFDTMCRSRIRIMNFGLRVTMCVEEGKRKSVPS